MLRPARPAGPLVWHPVGATIVSPMIIATVRFLMPSPLRLIWNGPLPTDRTGLYPQFLAVSMRMIGPHRCFAEQRDDAP